MSDLNVPEIYQLQNFQIFRSGDLSVPLKYWSCLLAPGVVVPMQFVVGDALVVPKVRDLLCESKHLFLLPSLTLFVKQRVGSVAAQEDWRKRATR